MSNWIEIGALNDIPVLGSRVVRTASGDIAVFRTADDEVFALDDRCPHKGGPLSQGIVHNKRIRPRWRTTLSGFASRRRRLCPPSEGDRPCQ
jgi:nitrite reductase/ring-hydroxylating ferredoxin subunit